MSTEIEAERNTRHEIRLTSLQLAGGVIALLTAIVGGVVSIVTLQSARSTAEGKADTAQEKVDNSQQDITALKKALSDAQTEITDLRSQLAATPAPATSEAPLESSPVYHAGVLTLADPDSAYLSTPADDPQWGSLKGGITDIRWDSFHGGGLRVNHVIADKPVSYETCSQSSGYAVEIIKTANLKSGFSFCVYTGGRFGFIKILRTARPEQSLRIKITVFKKDGDL
jgi:hypothetical protein